MQNFSPSFKNVQWFMTACAQKLSKVLRLVTLNEIKTGLRPLKFWICDAYSQSQTNIMGTSTLSNTLWCPMPVNLVKSLHISLLGCIHHGVQRYCWHCMSHRLSHSGRNSSIEQAWKRHSPVSFRQTCALYLCVPKALRFVISPRHNYDL